VKQRTCGHQAKSYRLTGNLVQATTFPAIAPLRISAGTVRHNEIGSRCRAHVADSFRALVLLLRYSGVRIGNAIGLTSDRRDYRASEARMRMPLMLGTQRYVSSLWSTPPEWRCYLQLGLTIRSIVPTVPSTATTATYQEPNEKRQITTPLAPKISLGSGDAEGK
jgi:hypothetical protein